MDPEPAGYRAVIDYKACLACALCLAQCPVQAIVPQGRRLVAGPGCIGCAACAESCPAAAIVLKRITHEHQ